MELVFHTELYYYTWRISSTLLQEYQILLDRYMSIQVLGYIKLWRR